MGQLEKYGLYVMCLVIFLILGVSLWDVGEPPTSVHKTPSTANETARIGATPVRDTTTGVDDLSIDSLFKPTERPRADKPPAKPAGNNGTPADATLGKGGSETNGDNVPAPSDAPKPAADTKRPTHKVRENETFESIAKTRLGSAALRSEIERLNPNVKPTRMRVGQEIVLPSAADLAPKTAPRSDARTPAPVVSADAVYTVKKGDTLGGIARKVLGDERRVEDLRRLNPNVEDTKLRIGQSLKLPKK